MVTRQQRIDDFDSAGEPPAGELMELLCEDHNGCPSRKSYPRVAMMQSGQDWCGDDGPRSLYGSS
jgi:hypothetical protein